tara:strand:- start:21299 stop:22054 length:756 start_codon:yes stop_codon:yes gene_type:complete
MKIEILNKKLNLFKIENFLSDQEYKIIKESFPKINFSEALQKSKNNDLKYQLKFGDTENDKYFKNNKGMQILIEKLISKRFLKKIYYNFLFKFIIIRKKNFFNFFFPLNILINEEEHSYLKNNLKLNIDYSYIFDGGSIKPHTDSKRKILTLMLYFPDFEEDKDDLKIKEENIGTQFYESLINNFNNKDVNKISNLFFDKKNTKKSLKTNFKKNTIYGFIKSKNSWHSVEKFNVKEGYIRKSININLYSLS